MVREKIDRMLDELPNEELDEVHWVIQVIYKKYLFKKGLLDKGVAVTQLFREAEDIIESWDNVFARNISEETKESIYYDQYKWHIFSYKMKNCLEQEAARDAFDAVSKDEIYVMYQDLPYIFLYQNASQVVSTDFDSEQDIYLFDRTFTWTYVHTHESMLGPYFFKVDRE